jgi:pimeloyl-ACP methyl ester carboxylesterase
MLATAPLIGCGGGDDPAPAKPVDPGPPEEPVVWGDCPEHFQTECARIDVPLRHEDPEGEKIPILVARRPSGTPDAPQLWLLQGGPGGSGASFYDLVSYMAEHLPGFDIYTLDHRGVGESQRIGCPDQEKAGSPNGVGLTSAEWAACAQDLKDTLGDKLSAFTITSAARDLGAVIERTRAPGQRTFVWGASYGTTWAMRYLQVFPDQAAGVVLDSIVSPGVQYLSQFDQQYDAVAQDFVALCAADAGCSSKLGADPWAFLGALYEKIDAGHCASSGLTRPLLREVMAVMLQGWDRRRYVLPFAYRVDRCAPEDITAMGHMFQAFFGEPFDGRGFSPVLQAHIALSELWETPAPSPSELTGRAGAALFSTDFGVTVGPVFDAWPRYDHDDLTDGWPDTSIPILMLNGSLDPQTPLETAQVAEERLSRPGQTFVAVPNAVHGVIGGSPVATPGALPCGSQITFSFLEAPDAPVDTACLSDLRPVSFAFTAEESQEVFGTDDVWENAPAPMGVKRSADAELHGLKSAAPRPLDVAALRRALARPPL